MQHKTDSQTYGSEFQDICTVESGMHTDLYGGEVET